MKSTNKLKTVLDTIIESYSQTEEFNIGMIDIINLPNDEIKLDVPLEKRTEHQDYQKLFVTYIQDDGTPKPMEHLANMVNNVKRMAGQAYNPDDGWENSGFSFFESPDKVILLQLAVKKVYEKTIK